MLASFIPDRERLITIEDAAELRLGKPHVVGLEARPPNANVTVPERKKREVTVPERPKIKKQKVIRDDKGDLESVRTKYE